jgi:phosphatidylserine decarboxylase
VLSPADGTLIVAEKVREEGTLKGEALKLSVFMTVFNVHVNRIPFDGTVLSVRRVPGAFVPADRAEASYGNNRVEVLLEDGQGRKALLVQVTGLIARRIICRLRPGDRVRRGERFGLICFGSRLDLFLPPEAVPALPLGAKVRAGECALADW